MRNLLTQTKAWTTKGLIRNTSDLVILGFSGLLIIRSKQDFGSSTIDHVSKNRNGCAEKNAQPAPQKAFPAKPFRSREFTAQAQANIAPPLSLLRKETCPRSSRAPLHLLLLPEGATSLQEPCRASGAAFLAQTVFNLEHNEKLDLQTLGKIPRSACRFLLHSYNKGLDSLPGFPQFHKEPLPQLHNNSKDFTKH